MYFVDREKIEATLVFFDEHVRLFAEHGSWNTEIEKKALERIVHLLIENVLDVGNAMIDGFIMRDPGSYDDIIDILVDEKVVKKEEETPLKEIVQLRKSLVQEYVDVKHQDIYQKVMQHKDVLAAFSERVRTYLETELGPVSAFRN
ncbi:DUF86 domain-containing protein [Priestia megaterium]|uniref:DUF86 domain-containing protein n=1 Tax=Priestia TaxID=2800373 RepID=UPI000D516731|nr:DUF86 domain-containing protein [Priestia megaterium]MBU8854816.1 DUF86 domain-containing protein [Bacillus sp. FJAT-26377]PVC76706.1 DUF86 domain-containing protein [Priestia megaterium]